ncbi:hypothetical protein ACFQU2_16640 [Siccirubricoccus deserti]|uniref:Uncharacterized protein n=1 Tax=Siccirubricoccus deserti TaxID=2013562 RepID=A0A9X0R3Q9_9PROT|nr:hypothetical protein [Siccirubricoccus deserti]MBC4019356.1 hypothetical protein [Siccirubricoccus deserti]
MKVIGAGLLWLASVTGAAAYFPTDIENHARWVVLDDMPLLASGQPVLPEVTDLRTNDIVAHPALISAVCGTLNFHNMNEGVTNFVVFYSVDDDGKMVVVGRPFLYGRLSARNFDAQYEAALEFCKAAEIPAVAGTGATTVAVGISDTGVAAQTEAAATAKRD